MNEMPRPLPLGAQIACVRRELRYRKSVYPRLVKDGRMQDETATWELRGMRAVLDRLTKILEAQQGDLFTPHAETTL